MCQNIILHSLHRYSYLDFVTENASKKSAKKSKKESPKTPEKPSEEEEATPSKEKVCVITLLFSLSVYYCVAQNTI